MIGRSVVGHETLYDYLVLHVCINSGGFHSICRVSDRAGLTLILSPNRCILRRKQLIRPIHIAHLFIFSNCFLMSYIHWRKVIGVSETFHEKYIMQCDCTHLSTLPHLFTFPSPSPLPHSSITSTSMPFIYFLHSPKLNTLVINTEELFLLILVQTLGNWYIARRQFVLLPETRSR